MKRHVAVCAAVGLLLTVAGQSRAQNPGAQFRNLGTPNIGRPMPGLSGYLGGSFNGAPGTSPFLFNPNLGSPFNQNQFNQNQFGQNQFNQNLYNQNLYNQNQINPYGINPYGINPYGTNPYQINPINPFNAYSPAVMNAPFGNPFFYTPQPQPNMGMNPGMNPFNSPSVNPMLFYAANPYASPWNPMLQFSSWQNPFGNPALQWMLYSQYQNPAIWGLPPVGAPVIGVNPLPGQTPK